jgi:hypothetical protein
MYGKLRGKMYSACATVFKINKVKNKWYHVAYFNTEELPVTPAVLDKTCNILIYYMFTVLQRC